MTVIFLITAQLAHIKLNQNACSPNKKKHLQKIVDGFNLGTQVVNETNELYSYSIID